VDEPDAMRLDTDRRYRLVTLPVEPRTDREFAAQLRTAAETMGVVRVSEGSALVDRAVGDVDIAVVAIGTAGGDIEAIPSPDRRLTAGETIYAVGRPDRLRKLESESTDPARTGTDD